MANLRLRALLVLCTLWVVGCSCSEDDGNDAVAGGGASGSGGGAGAGGMGGSAGSGGGAGLDLFTAWERAREAMRASPDHLPARADALVAEADPVALFEFVRDQIATYPSAPNGFESAGYAQRWGVRGTLRGGAGTPREKAELLADLYRRAGFDAEVVRGAPDPARVTGEAVLLRDLQRRFEPPISEAEAEEWRVALGHPTPPARTSIDADGSEAAALGTQLIALLPDTLTAPFDFTLTDMPLVRVRVDGSWQYANPLVPGATFGDPMTVAEPTPTSGGYDPGRMRIVLEAARADAPYERFPLLERTYDVVDVVGRRIQIGFAPPVSAAALAGMRVQDVETVVPVLSVMGHDLTAEDRERLATVGDMLSLGGDRYQTAEDGSLLVNGQPVLEGATDPAAIARVASVGISVAGNTYPRIGVTVSALDAGGLNVPGLGAGAFELLEDGEPVSFSISRNQAPPPRVVLLFDASTSLPEEFRGAGAVTIGNQIVAALYAAHPAAQVRVGVINFGADFMATTWATSQAEAETQVAAVATAPGSSEIWEALYDTLELDPTVVIMLTDGDATDMAEPRFRNAVASGAPILSLAAGTVNQAVLDDISALSRGRSVPVAMQQEAIDAAVAEIDARSVEDYQLSYQAPPGTATTRTVTVTINGHSAEGTYTIPAMPALPPALSGLYLTVGVSGRERTVAVAGFSAGYSTAFPTITQAMLDDVRALLLGRISIAVEGAAPPASVVLDDWISDKLSLRPLWEAAESRDTAAIVEALESGINVAPPKLPIAQPPLPGASSSTALTFETGPRVAAMIQKTGLGGPVTRQLDLFPLSQWATAAADPRAAWERTLSATAGLAVVEAGLFSGTSTLEGLAGQALTLVDPGGARDQAGLTDLERLQWAELESQFGAEYQLLVPLRPGPFWAIHELTGSVIGVLSDGTGGGAEDVCATYDAANAYIQMMSLLGSLFGVPLGGWAAIAQWEVKNLTMATLVIGYGGTAQDISNPAIDGACGMLNDAIGDAIPAYGAYDAITGTLDAIGADTGAPTLCGGGGVCE